MASERVFHFSSLQHPGCQIYLSGQTIMAIEVAAVRDYTLVYDGTATHRVNGTTRVYGILYGWETLSPNYTLHTDDPAPVDVEVHAFDPENNKDYVMAVFGAHIVDSTTGEFVAAALRPWYDVNSKKPTTIPSYWFDGDPSSKVVPETNHLVGALETWKESGKDYQHIDKSIQEIKTGRRLGKEAGRYVAGTIKWMPCAHCGNDLDIVTGFCVSCGLSILTAAQPPETKGQQNDGNRDTAHIGPWTTVRACLDCGVLISGGPTRCLYCVNNAEKKESTI